MTSICQRLNIPYPLFQAGMASISSPALAAAVSEAGGFGSLAATGMDLTTLRQQIVEMRCRTAKGFGVNFITPFLDEELLYACLDEGVAALSFHWGTPTQYLSDIRSCGAAVFQQVCSIAEGVRAADAGADCIIAQSFEAGGHSESEVGAMALIPAMADAIPEVPMLAAGGIVDGRGVAAALVLGAAGAWMGTRFLASAECRAHPLYKDLVTHAVATDTVRTRLFDRPWGNALHRVLRSDETDEWAGRESLRPAADVIGASDAGGRWHPVPRFSSIPPSTASSGQIAHMAMYAGQGCGLVTDVLPAGDIVRKIMIDVEACLLRASRGVRLK